MFRKLKKPTVVRADNQKWKDEDRAGLFKRIATVLEHGRKTGKPVVVVDARGKAYVETTWDRKKVLVPLSSLPPAPNRRERRARARAVVLPMRRQAEGKGMRSAFRGITTRQEAFSLNDIPKAT
jgi:hypothetical protein